jgi:hypothetical protein
VPVGPGWVGGSHWQYTPIRLGTTVAPWHRLLSGRICRRNLRNPEASGTFARELQVSSKETERGGRRIGNPGLAGIAGFGKSGIFWPGPGRDRGNLNPPRCPGIGDFGVWPGAVPETLNSKYGPSPGTSPITKPRPVTVTVTVLSPSVTVECARGLPVGRGSNVPVTCAARRGHRSIECAGCNLPVKSGSRIALSTSARSRSFKFTVPRADLGPG